MHMLKLQRLTAKLGKTAWNDISSMHVPDKAALGVLHLQIMAQKLRTLHRKFVSSLRNNLFGINPRTGRHGDRLQLIYPLLYGPHINTLLQDNEEELDSYVWFLLSRLTRCGACRLSRPGLPSSALQQSFRESTRAYD